jgi:hypothetical protein
MTTRLVALLLFLLGPCLLQADAGDWQKEYDKLLQKYVADGGVRYAKWKANTGDIAALRRVVTAIGK